MDRITNGTEGRIYCNLVDIMASKEQSLKQYCEWTGCKPLDCFWSLLLKCTVSSYSQEVLSAQQGALCLKHARHFVRVSGPASPITMNSRVLLNQKVNSLFLESKEDYKLLFSMNERFLNNNKLQTKNYKYTWKWKIGEGENESERKVKTGNSSSAIIFSLALGD